MAEAHVVAMELLKMRTRGILDKLTPTSFHDLLSDFTSLLTIKDPGHENTGYQMDCSWDQEETESIVEVLFDKAVEEPLQCPTYADLCFRVVDVQLKRPGNQNHSSTFRNVLVKTCQRFFEANGDNVEVMAKKRKLEAELSENRPKEEQRSEGAVVFFGELYREREGKRPRVLPEEVLESVVRGLVEAEDEGTVGLLCALLRTLGGEARGWWVRAAEHRIQHASRRTLRRDGGLLRLPTSLVVQAQLALQALRLPLLPFVGPVINSGKDHATIECWELGREFQAPKSSQTPELKTLIRRLKRLSKDDVRAFAAFEVVEEKAVNARLP